CLGIVPLLNRIGGPNTVLFTAAMAAIAGAVWATARFPRRLALSLAAILLIIAGANRSGRLIDIVYAKGHFRDKSWVEFARWNAISRVEVDRQGAAKAVVIDADASTYIMNVDPKLWQKDDWQDTEWYSDLMDAPPALANILRPHGAYA